MSPNPAKDIALLKAACDAAVKNPLFALGYPVAGITHCNAAVQSVAAKMGCEDFKGMMANDIIARMERGFGWQKVDRQEFSDWAQTGGLAVCGQKDTPHGHAAVGYPAPLSLSGSLGIKVPMIANVGKTQGVMRVSGAFPVAKGEPSYFIWIGV